MFTFARIRTVSKHLKNIYQDGELEREATVSILETIRKRQVMRQIEHYNLDAIISVGYRVNSRACAQVQFSCPGASAGR